MLKLVTPTQFDQNGNEFLVLDREYAFSSLARVDFKRLVSAQVVYALSNSGCANGRLQKRNVNDERYSSTS
jgi:hypothetical protein